MSKTWAGAPGDRAVDAGAGTGWRGRSSAVADRRDRDRTRAAGRRRAVALLVLAGVVLGLVVTGVSLARDDDAFSGVWWEPSSGRRVEIVRDGDRYTLLYGAERRPFAAEERDGGELRIAAPLGGDIVVRAVARDRLELVDGGTTTVLQPAPGGS